MGMVVVAFFAANAGAGPDDHDQIDLKTNQVRRKLRQALRIFPSANRYSMVKFFPSIQPSLFNSCRNASTRTALPDSSAYIQETDAEDFPRLLRVGGTAKRKEHGAKRKDGDFSLHVFLLCLDPLAPRHSTLAPSHLIT